MFFDHAFIDAMAAGLLLSAVGLGWIIVLVRIVGLRSFSKMTNFDFVMTVAMGSLLAGAAQAGEWPGLVQTMTAMAAFFGSNSRLPMCARGQTGSTRLCKTLRHC